MEKENKAFCILPWIHAQVRQNGDVYPCCRVKHRYSYGSTLEKPLAEIWNSDEIKKVRKEMLSGISQSFCSDCHTTEDLGSESYRQMVNKDYKNEASRIAQTAPDGHLDNNDIIYLDIRFSNVCNFKCRSCSPESSNSWFDEYQKIYKGTDVQKRTFKLSESKTALSDIEKLLPKIHKIYFAGGEPLLDENHYKLLEKLIELNRTDVHIFYNTNLSHLTFKNWKVLHLWKKFKFIKISASIDATGPALELVRKGAVWDDIVSNLVKIRTFNPEVMIQIYPTVSLMNCYLLPELIGYFIDHSYIKVVRNFELNLLNDPEYLNVSVLNSVEIESLAEKYRLFSESIKSKVSEEILSHIKSELSRVITFAKHQDLTQMRTAFKKFTFTLDKLRNEKTAQVIPELFNLLYE